MAQPSGALVWDHQRGIRGGSSFRELITKIEQFVAAYNKSKALFK